MFEITQRATVDWSDNEKMLDGIWMAVNAIGRGGGTHMTLLIVDEGTVDDDDDDDDDGR